MNKKIFSGLVVLMGISIIGIITIQLIWLNNAIKVKNELFGRSVAEAINSSVARLEHQNDLAVFNRMILRDSLRWKTVPPPPPPPKIIYKKNQHQGTIGFIQSTGNQSGNIRVQVFRDTNSSGSNFYRYDVKTSETKNTDLKRSKENSDNRFLVLKNDSVVCDLDSVYGLGIVKLDSIVTHLDTIDLGMPVVRKRVEEKAVRLKKVANQIVTEIRSWDVKKIDFNQVGKVLKEEFENSRIPIHFDYGIIKDSILTARSAGADSSKLRASVFQANLYPNDIIQKNLKLAVYFPGKDSFILQSLNWLLSVSFLLSLIILTTFALSIFFILRQKKISEMKSDFINNMTHEFKTPIATITVAIDSITNEKVLSDQEKVRFFAGMIKKENIRMNRQVEDILTIARLDKKDFEFRWEPVNAHEMIDDAIQGIVLQVEKRGGKINPVYNAVNPVITSDKNHFTNMVYNLLDNANKYSADSPEIMVLTRNNAKGIIISVEDKGIGMTRSVQSKIFERFYRQTSGNIHNVKGFGLGLSYVKAVVEANQGNISVDSEPGRGSRFEVFLPFIRE